MNIRNTCQKNVVTIAPTASILEAAQIMRDQQVGDLVVVAGTNGSRQPVGMLTDRDIVRYVVANGALPQQTLVQDIMARNLITISENEGIYEAIQTMKNAAIRRLPVVTVNGALCGIVTADDLLALVAVEMRRLTSISSAQQKQEGAIAHSAERFHK